ncbi:MAG: hypothetical protein H7A41_03640 [Chlamydiales bacterium]|nr:hypothetical protein [Chlamydiia bacterium]MCP5504228.1 hypothetical protein [Chlamydiales bacterium]
MTQMPQDEASKEKMQLLLYQLGELLNDPPIVINLPDWRDSIEDIMDEIEELSPYARDRLQDLITEAIRRAEVHVDDLDSDASPNKTEMSAQEYYTQVAFVSSEINALKSI